MSGTTQKPVSDPATVALHALAEKIDALAAAWEGDDLPPDLAQLLPQQPLALRLLVLTELIKVDLEYRWQQHELPKLIEEYAEEFPELSQHGGLPCELIYEEFHVRRQTENPPSPEDYFDRFPQQAESLRRMMTLEPDRATTSSIVAGSRGVDVQVGQQIDDFDLLIRLGKGSFGSVFLARQRSMQRLVALKISRDRGVEPQTLAQLDHPHIVRVYDRRILLRERLQLMYMQHIPGGTLQDVLDVAEQQELAQRCGKTLLASVDQLLEHHGQSPIESSARRRLISASWPETVCWLGSRMAAALEYAHSKGVLHRDVKPANVLLAADGSPKLVDFNVSFSSKVEGSTPAAYFGGSLPYMSPEQIEAYNPDHSRKPDELDGRSDVYSLGVVMWELLTGKRPFGEEHMGVNWSETLRQLTDRRRGGLSAEALATLPADLPPGLREVLTSCLASEVEDRPATAGILARQLELCLQSRVQGLLRPMPGSLWQRMRRWAFWAFVIIGVMPSALFSVLNLLFNAKRFIPPSGEVHDFFWDVEVPTVNAVAFPVAVFLVFRFAWSVLVAVGRLGSGKKVDSKELVRLRRRALYVGDYAAWVSMGLWAISGVIFPLWQHLHFVGVIEGVGAAQYRNFLGSQFICGWISSTLTFFLLTFMFVRAFYPVLVRPEEGHREEVKDLMRLERRCIWCLGLTVLAPFCAVGLLTLSITEDMKGWMGGLAAIGGLGSIASFYLLQTISGDLAAWTMALDPSRDPASGASEGIDTFRPTAAQE